MAKKKKPDLGPKIAKLIDEGKPRDQAIAIAISMNKKKKKRK
jgi:uncharacterized Ntn-hydrolase superfamily protein